MRFVFLLIAGFLLTACSLEEMAEKILPDDIEQKSHDVVAAVFAEDVDYFLPLKNAKISDEDFQKNVLSILQERSGGEIISKHIVSANNNTSVSTETGKTKEIDISHEIETEDGYTLITTHFKQSRDETVCCALVNMTVQKFDTSPAYKTILLIEKVGKIIAVMIPIGLLIVLGLVLRSRRKRRT